MHKHTIAFNVLNSIINQNKELYNNPVKISLVTAVFLFRLKEVKENFGNTMAYVQNGEMPATLERIWVEQNNYVIYNCYPFTLSM